MITRITCVIALVVTVTTSAQTPPAGQATTAPVAPLASATLSCPELGTALTRVAAQDVRLRDWQNVTRYRAANVMLKPAAPGEQRVVFMGDSITDLWQEERFGGFFPGKPYIDRGISGQTTPQMLIRFRPDVLELQPKAVVILAGTNDIAGNTGPMTNEEIEGNLASMSELAKAHGVRVVLASILPVSESHVRPNLPPQTTLRPMTRIRAVNDWIKAYAAREGHVYLDYFSAMVDANGLLREDLSADDLHPTAKGYAIMAPLAEAAIATALNRRTEGKW